MIRNKRGRHTRPKYSKKHYKNLVIPDKDEFENQKNSRSQRIDGVRTKIMEETGYVEGYQSEIKRKRRQETKSKIVSNFLNIGVKAVIAVMVVSLIALAGISAIPASAKTSYTDGYEVLLNGNVLGVTDSVEPISVALDEIREEFRSVYNMTVFDDTTLEYNPVKIDMQFICPSRYFIDILKETVDIKVMAWVILVNNAPAAAVRTEEEAQEALDRVLEPFLQDSTESARIEVGFVENVEVTEMPIEYSQLGDSEDSYKLLRFGSTDVKEVLHTVVYGESLYSIANTYDLKISDLRKANPKVASTSKIYPDDILLCVEPNNRVNVKFVETIDRTEPMDFEIEVIPDDSMLVTETVVVQAGIDGSHDINAEITYINGVETEVNVISETVLRQPVNQIVRKGTQEVPKIIELAATGGMDMPLKSGTYKISSKFGPRNIDVEGASTWHKGVDLAANTGTPIYASDAGTVTKSGSGTGYGLYIKIDHGNGVETRYGHCSQLIAKKGDKVEAGELIALVGNTGVSGGSHLHFEVRVNGVAYDPLGEYPTAAPS